MQYKIQDELAWYGDDDLLLKGPISLLPVKILPVAGLWVFLMHCCFFIYYKNCPTYLWPDELLAVFHVGCCSCFRGRSFLWVWGMKGFFQPGSISILFLALAFLSLPVSTMGQAWSCKFHFLLYVQILLITSTSLTLLLGIPAFLPSVLTALILTIYTWRMTMPFLLVSECGLLSKGRTLWCCRPISKIMLSKIIVNLITPVDNHRNNQEYSTKYILGGQKVLCIHF